MTQRPLLLHHFYLHQQAHLLRHVRYATAHTEGSAVQHTFKITATNLALQPGVLQAIEPVGLERERLCFAEQRELAFTSAAKRA